MMFYVTVQSYWHDAEGRRCVEIGSGEPGPGMLTGYDAHYVESPHWWVCARAAVESAAALGFPITTSNSFVYGDPDDAAEPAELLVRAQELEDAAPKCAYCGEASDVTEWTFYEGFPDDPVLACSESHAELAMEREYPYVVVSGMPGYMPNQCYRVASWAEARAIALEDAKRWRDSEYDLDKAERRDWEVSYSGDSESFYFGLGSETIEAYKA